jgi:manganese/zinc/iron transport system permease protein
MGWDGKSLPILLLGATVTGLIGVGAILVLRHRTRLKEDTALGAVLSVFFGAGVALLGVIQQMQGGHAAGLEAFIYGKTASMAMRDTLAIAVAAVLCIGACLLLFKELKLLCFDEGFAGARGFPAVRLDIGLMALIVTVCIVGLQAVGLILVIALLVIPAAAARFWTDTMWKMFLISGVLGAVGGMVGAGVSAVFPRLPSGAMIVLVCAALFLLSMVFGTVHGLLIRGLHRIRLNRAVDHQHLLRDMYELLEAFPGEPHRPSSAGSPEDGLPGDSSAPQGLVAFGDLLAKRSWSSRRLRQAIHRAGRAGLLERRNERLRLTEPGVTEAARQTRQHRLWELYLITYADVAPGRVDRQADAIEHILEPELLAELGSLLDERRGEVPASPHPLASPHPRDVPAPPTPRRGGEQHA